MQFIPNGPSIPSSLLQAHEEGRVVFFCGSGIAMGAGLKTFAGLVDAICEKLCHTKSAVEAAAYKNAQYDVVLNLLEQSLSGQRLQMRETLQEILKPNIRRKYATSLHQALLTLALTRENKLRLVTTNYDHLFLTAARKNKQRHQHHAAPMLPIPNNSWNSLIYLHGLLPTKKDEQALNQLVLTSGDFGLAYLKHRWAARFLSELFSNYVVCFIGYSVNDAVMRYMVDALSAEQMQGETKQAVYAFASYRECKRCQKCNKDKTQEEWLAKGITPVLYSDNNQHQYLRDTLESWADAYLNGSNAKARQIAIYISSAPLKSTAQNDFLSRMEWALNDSTGKSIEALAEAEPLPSLDWLDFLTERGLLNLISWQTVDRLNLPSIHYCRWLVRYLNEPKLFFWLLESAPKLHSELKEFIQDALNAQNQPTTIKRPSSAPISNAMATLWDLLLAGYASSSNINYHYINLSFLLNKTPLTLSEEKTLREALAPKVMLRPENWPNLRPTNRSINESIASLVRWEVRFSSHLIASFFRKKDSNQAINNHAELLVEICHQSLTTSLKLMHLVSDTQEVRRRSLFDLPSISDHQQNWHKKDWTLLIEILRDAWLVLLNKDPSKARFYAKQWLTSSNLLMQRLGLFAASHGVFKPSVWLKVLLSSKYNLLWLGPHREVSRLLVKQAKQFTPKQSEKLQKYLLTGYKGSFANPTPNYLLLSKLVEGGVELTNTAQNYLDGVMAENVEIKLSTVNQKEEFNHFANEPLSLPSTTAEQTIPLKHQELVIWLQNNPTSSVWNEDDWGERCKKRFCNSFLALTTLAKQGEWLEDRWTEAFYAWASNKYLLMRSWRYVTPFLLKHLSQHISSQQVHALAYWLWELSKHLTSKDEHNFSTLCQLVLNTATNTDEPLTSSATALNHYLGLTTDALIQFWLNQNPQDKQGLPTELKPIFTFIAAAKPNELLNGLIGLAENLVSFYRTDPEWAKTNLLPKLDWQANDKHTVLVWGAFLTTMKVEPALITEIKINLLETANKLNLLNDLAVNHYALLMGNLALGHYQSTELFSEEEIRSVIHKLDEDELVLIVGLLEHQMQSTREEQKLHLWQNKLANIVNNYWPKTNQVTPKITNAWVSLLLNCGQAFPKAYQALRHYLTKDLEATHQLEYNFKNEELLENHPDEVLDFMNQIIVDGNLSINNIKNHLEIIAKAKPQLKSTAKYLSLWERIA